MIRDWQCRIANDPLAVELHMARFTFEITPVTREFCVEIAQSLMAFGNLSQDDAVALINIYWGDEPFDDDVGAVSSCASAVSGSALASAGASEGVASPSASGIWAARYSPSPPIVG